MTLRCLPINKKLLVFENLLRINLMLTVTSIFDALFSSESSGSTVSNNESHISSLLFFTAFSLFFLEVPEPIEFVGVAKMSGLAKLIS